MTEARLRLGHSVRTDRQLVHYPIRILPVISETKVLVWLEKRSSCHGNRELSILYIGFDIRLAIKKLPPIWKKNFFSQNCVLGRYGAGCGFPIRNLEGQKKRKVKASQFAIAINTLTRPQPTHFTFSFTGLNWPFITRVPDVYLWLFVLSFFFSEAKLAHLALARFS